MSVDRGWKRLDPEGRKQEFEERTREGVSYIDPSVPQFRVQDGDNCVRLVPPLGDEPLGDQWGFNIWVHFLNGYHICPRTFDKNASCAICTAASQMRREDPDLAKKMSGSPRTLLWILDCNRVAQGELKLWPAPVTLINSFLKLAKNRRTGALISIEGPDEGRAIFFEKTGSRLQTRYDSISLDDAPFPLDPALVNDMRYFEEVLVLSTNAEMEAAVENFLNSEGAGDEPIPENRGTAHRVADEVDPPPPPQNQEGGGGRVRPGSARTAGGGVSFARKTGGDTAGADGGDKQLLTDVRSRIKKRLQGITSPEETEQPPAGQEDDVPF